MSTHALLAVYLNGNLTKTYFHHWDGYMSYLGNNLITFERIVHVRLNYMAGELMHATNKKRNEVIGARSPIDMLQPLLDAEGGFGETDGFNDYWCLEYIYRLNFVFKPKKRTFKWEVSLDYTKDISAVPQKWSKRGYIPIVCAEGVHYKTENKLHIRPDLKKYYEQVDLTTD